MTTDSPLFRNWNRAFRMTALDFIVPDAPKMAICLLSLVSFGIQTVFPPYSPKITPSAWSGVVTSKSSFTSFSVIHSAVPNAPELLFLNPLGSYSLLSNLSWKRMYKNTATQTNVINRSPFRLFMVNALFMHTKKFQSGAFTPSLPDTPSA